MTDIIIYNNHLSTYVNAQHRLNLKWMLYWSHAERLYWTSETDQVWQIQTLQVNVKYMKVPWKQRTNSEFENFICNAHEIYSLENLMITSAHQLCHNQQFTDRKQIIFRHKAIFIKWQCVSYGTTTKFSINVSPPCASYHHTKS